MKKKLKCVLLVDDNESDNFLHERVLKKAGVVETICTALNGKEALDILEKKGKGGSLLECCCQPDIIFLDINMPVMDGWEFLDEYHARGFDKKGKIIIMMLTTSINPSDKMKAEKHVQSDCFQYKPLTIKVINEILEHHFLEYL